MPGRYQEFSELTIIFIFNHAAFGGGCFLGAKALKFRVARLRPRDHDVALRRRLK